jgi:hypothetical protein
MWCPNPEDAPVMNHAFVTSALHFTFVHFDPREWVERPNSWQSRLNEWQ